MITYSDDLLEDMSDNFLNEFNKCELYEVLAEASKDPLLRQDLNERYLTDYLNMVYAAQSDLEFQVCHENTFIQPNLKNVTQCSSYTVELCCIQLL